MCIIQSAPRRLYRAIVFTGLLLYMPAGLTLEFQPGVGAGFEYTDNAKLSPDNEVDDLIAVTYVGASIAENEGPLNYGATAALNKTNYTQDTYTDRRYFNLAADAGWEMVKDTFNWRLQDHFSQRTVVSLNSNTPDNLQDTNVFTLSGIYSLLISPRKNFSLTPTFSQYYYEILNTDNKQYALAANWNYQMTRLTNVGFDLGSRKINYTETDIFGQSISDTTFTNAAIVFSGKRLRSDFFINLGATNVKRDGGGETTGFTGNANWSATVSSRSNFKTLISTDLTDTNSVGVSSSAGPVPGNPDDVQISTDVIRSSVLNFTYLRDDASLKSRVYGEYRKLTYSESPLDRIIRTLGARFSYPVTQLLSSSAYANYIHTEQLDTQRLDERYTIGGNLKYNFSRKLHGLFDVNYRTKVSTDYGQNYDEFSVFFSLVYGFGDVRRPSRGG